MIATRYCPHCRAVKQMIQTYHPHYRSGAVTSIDYRCLECRLYVVTEYTPKKEANDG